MNYDTPASKESLDNTVKALKEKHYHVFVTQNGLEALEKIKTLIPKGVSVMNGSSKTLQEIGYSDYLKTGQSGWNDLHAKVDAESDPVKRAEIRKTTIFSDFYLGSIHAITEDGQMVIASNTGSQIPHLASTSPNLILVIGTQKIIQDVNAGIKRIEDYIFPLEDKRLKELYGVGTMISKILIFRNENARLGRKINVILVNEKLGF